MKLINYITPRWEKKQLQLKVCWYINSGQIAIILYDQDEKEDYCDLSVFVQYFAQNNLMCVDTNNFPDWEEIIQKYNLWTYKWKVYSGFCAYPIYEMNLDKLVEFDEEWVSLFKKICCKII